MSTFGFDWAAFGGMLLPVTLGSVVGGAAIALVYWIVHLRGEPGSAARG